MRNATKKIVLGAGLTVAGVSAIVGISYFITKSMVQIAMNREEPKIMQRSKQKISGSTDLTQALELAESAEARLLEAGCETVEIESHDGLKLVGHWYAGKNPKRVIIAMHGWRSSWSRDFGLVSDFWFENDCAVLFAEQRGQGNSEGAYMSFGLLERYDCRAWMDFVNERIGGALPIYLHGLSMGATTVLMAGGLELPENVCGIVADCGFTSTADIWEHVAEKNLKIPYGRFNAALAERFSRQNINLGTKEYSTVEAMKVCKVPVLFIHGTDDHFVPIEMTYQNYQACAAPRQMIIVPGADHAMSYLLDQARCEEALLAFWEDFD